MRRPALVALAIVTLGCGASPSSPTPQPPPPAVLAISGQWTGTFSFLIDGSTPSTSPITATLTQAPDRSLTGAFQFGSRGTATLAGALAGTAPGSLLSATLAIETPADQAGVLCHGTALVSGPVEMATMRLAAARLTSLDCAGDVTDVVLTLRR